MVKFGMLNFSGPGSCVQIDREPQLSNVELSLGSVGLLCFNNQKQKNVKNHSH